MPTACSPVGPVFGGAVTRHCLAAIVGEGVELDPEGVGAVLRAAHLGQEISLSWEAARALLPGELFLLRRAADSATAAFASRASYDDAVRSHRETDSNSALQFFELRVLNRCGTLSADEFPPSR